MAERILTLGKPPYSTFCNYIRTSTIKEINTIGMKDTNMVIALIADMATMIEMERAILEITSNAGDVGTNNRLLN